MNFHLLKNKKIIGVVSLLVLVLLIVPKPALAFLDCLQDPVECAFDVLLSILSMIVDFVGMILIGIAASIVNFVFNFQGFIKVPLVQIGWTLSRDVANMAFILIMLAMAFGTILRFESYGWKKLLPRLIIMALLINFSLMIAGGVIDVANSIARFFITGGGNNNVGDMIMSSIRAGSIAQIRNNVATAGFGSAINSLIMVTIVQLIFYIIIAFLLFALGFMMIIRIIKLWIMIILAPFSWIGWAIPFTSGSLKKWWSDFLHQAFFPALMGFFIFLGTLAGSTLGGTDFERFSKDVGGFWDILIPTTLFSSIMQFIVVVFILFMGLNMANSWSSGAGKAMVKLAGDGQKWALGKAKTAVSSRAKRAAGWSAERALYKKGEGGKRTELRESLQGLASTGYGVGKVFGKAMRLPTAMVEQRQKVIKGAEDKLKNNSSTTLKTIFSGLDNTAKAAAIRILADKGDLEFTKEEDVINKKLKASGSTRTFKDLSDDEKTEARSNLTETEKREVGQINESKMGGITQERFEAALKFNGSAGLDKEILNAAPQFAAIVGKKIQDVIDKMPSSKADKIQAGSLELKEVREAIQKAIIEKKWEAGHLNRIAEADGKTKATADLLEYLRDNLTSTEKENLSDKTYNFIQTGGAVFASEGRKEKRKKLVSGTETEFQEAIRQRDTQQNQQNNQLIT